MWAIPSLFLFFLVFFLNQEYNFTTNEGTNCDIRIVGHSQPLLFYFGLYNQQYNFVTSESEILYNWTQSYEQSSSIKFKAIGLPIRVLRITLKIIEKFQYLMLRKISQELKIDKS